MDIKHGQLDMEAVFQDHWQRFVDHMQYHQRDPQPYVNLYRSYFYEVSQRNLEVICELGRDSQQHGHPLETFIERLETLRADIERAQQAWVKLRQRQQIAAMPKWKRWLYQKPGSKPCLNQKED